MISLLEYIWNALGKALAFLATIPGMITAAVTGFVAFIGSCFADAFDLSGVSSVISQLSSWLGELSSLDSSSGAAQFIIYVTGVDTLCSDGLLSVTITFGLTLVLLVGCFSAFLAILFPALAIRGTLKLISVVSAGFVKPLVVFCLLPAFAFGGLTVVQPSPGVVIVSGEGDGTGPNVVVTNVVGYCTNCVGATVQQIKDTKEGVHQKGELVLRGLATSKILAALVKGSVQARNSDVSKFISCGGQTNPNVEGMGYQLVRSHSLQVDCTQSSLCKSYVVWSPNGRTSYSGLPESASTTYAYCLVGYNDGIYDFAHSQDASYSELLRYADEISENMDILSDNVSGMIQIVDYIPETPCDDIAWIPQDPPGSGGSVTNVPGVGVEQLQAILDYLDHIDRDQHDRYAQLVSMTNTLHIMEVGQDAYYKLLGSALFQGGGTIVTDDAGNSWSNVYNRGESSLYDYNRSNVLQRIELLLYGISGIAPTEGTDPDFTAADTGVTSVAESMDAAATVANDGIASAGGSINYFSDALSGFFRSSSFLGSGSVQSQFTNSYSIDFGNEHYSVYGLSVESDQQGVLRSASRIVRICFQVVWHLSCIVLIFYYYRWFLLAAYKMIKWASEVINSVFGS